MKARDQITFTWTSAVLRATFGVDMHSLRLRRRAVLGTLLLLTSTACGGPALARGGPPRGPESDPPSQKDEIYLMAGASNLGGRGVVRHLPRELREALPGVLYTRSHRFPVQVANWEALRPDGKSHGIELTFARSLVSAGHRPGLAKYSVGGSGLASSWLKKNGWYRQAAAFFRARLATYPRPYRVAGFLWVAGGDDASSAATADAYDTNLKQLISLVRTDFGSDLPVVVYQPHVGLAQPFTSIVRAKTLEVAGSVKGVHVVHVDDQPLGKDGIHLPSRSLRVLGDRAAAALQ